MCGDGIIDMWNVNFVRDNLNPNTLTKSYARILVSVNHGLYQLDHIKTQRRESRRYNDGIEILLDKYLRTNIDQSQSLKHCKSYEQLDIIKNTLKRKNKMTKHTGLGVEDTMQDILTGKPLAS